MERHLPSGLRGTRIVLCLLSLALAATLAVGGTGGVLAGSARDGPTGPSGVLLPDLYYGDAQDPTERQPSDTGTANISGDATLVSLTVTGDDGAIPLSPAFDPETTFYTTTSEADRVLVEAETAKDTATIVAFAVDDKTVAPEMDEDKLTTRIQVLEGAVTDFSLTVKAEDGATFETYHVLFARPSTQSLPEITIEASRSEYVAGIGPLSYTVVRAGDTTSDLDLTLNFAEDEQWLGFPSHPITIFAGNPSATLTFRPWVFPSYVYVTRSGVLTATVAPVSSYDTSGATVQVRVISQEGPPVTVSFEEAQYSVGEGVGEFSPMLVARAASGVPYVDEFSVAVLTKAKEANSPGDYPALSQEINFLPGDFAEEDGLLVGRVEVSVTVIDDRDVEGDEQFGLELSIASATPWGVSLLDSDGTRCLGVCFNDYLVTILDNDQEPDFSLSVSTDRIEEMGNTTATITIENTNGAFLPRDNTITVNFGGPAVYGDDYTVIPADTDDGIEGHQMTLSAGTAAGSLTVTAVDDADADSCEWIGVSATVGEDSTAIQGEGEIALLDDDEGSLDTIATLTVGLSGILTGSLTAADEGRDWYSFEATGGTSYIIEVKHPMTFSPIDERGIGGNPSQIPGYLVDPSILEVIDDMDAQLLGEHGQGGFTLNFARAFFTPEDDGTYYIKVGAGRQDRSGLGCYTISVREDDHADDFQTQSGVVIRPGESVAATIDSDVATDDPGLTYWDWKIQPPLRSGGETDDVVRPRRGIESLDDRDVFRYEIAEDGTYRLSLTGQPTGVGIWYIWDYQGNLWLEATVAPVATVQWHHEPGTYYAEVGTPYESEGNTGTYTLLLTAVTDDDADEEAVRRSAGPGALRLAEDLVLERLGEN